MWRRPVGFAGSGPGRSPKISDLDLLQMPGIKVVGGRVLSQEFIDEMVDARGDAPPPVDFVQQMRERKQNNGTS